METPWCPVQPHLRFPQADGGVQARFKGLSSKKEGILFLQPPLTFQKTLTVWQLGVRDGLPQLAAPPVPVRAARPPPQPNTPFSNLTTTPRTWWEQGNRCERGLTRSSEGEAEITAWGMAFVKGFSTVLTCEALGRSAFWRTRCPVWQQRSAVS